MQKSLTWIQMRLPIRNIDLGGLHDTFLVCAVGTVLVIRFQLWVMNYPQLAPGKLHIAHMLWGGILMMIAIIVMISFITRSARVLGAILGGIGFGFFIDELGKFITADNDYFFKPTAALIYIIFILIYLGLRSLRNRRGFSPRENLVNALEVVKEGAIRGIDEPQKRRALELLNKAGRTDRLHDQTQMLLDSLKVDTDLKPSINKRVERYLHSLYTKIVETKLFNKAITAVFILFAIQSVIQIVSIVLFTGATIVGLNLSEILDRAFDQAENLSFVSWATIISSLISGIFFLVGVLRLRESRLDAFRLFDRGLLISIFVTQVFIFVESQFASVIGLGVNLVLLVFVRYVIGQEGQIGLELASE